MPESVMVHACPICGAMTLAEAMSPPHGWGNPCPQKLAIDKAYVEMLDAQRMSFIRAADAQQRIARGGEWELDPDDDDD